MQKMPQNDAAALFFRNQERAFNRLFLKNTLFNKR